VSDNYDAEVVEHFTARAAHYDDSSSWCTDDALAAKVWELTSPAESARVLDVACGTGLVSRVFKGRVAEVVGVDITPAMYEQAAPHLDRFVEGPGEALPFADDSFDVVTCRQGTQFMDDAAAIREMFRVVKPGGVVCVINLCAYSEADRAEYFEVLRLRNPARRNFYLREDLVRLFEQAGGKGVVVHDYISVEDVDVWSDNKAISEERREAIRAVYRGGSPGFRQHHAVEITDDGRIVDHMLFGIATGRG
jgi:ubiquinone/menaquinone biosynthesis C-methylase UbiE